MDNKITGHKAVLRKSFEFQRSEMLLQFPNTLIYMLLKTVSKVLTDRANKKFCYLKVGYDHKETGRNNHVANAKYAN